MSSSLELSITSRTLSKSGSSRAGAKSSANSIMTPTLLINSGILARSSACRCRLVDNDLVPFSNFKNGITTIIENVLLLENRKHDFIKHGERRIDVISY